MNGPQILIKETPELQQQNLKVSKEDSYVRKMTTIGANKIILELPDSTFLEGDKIKGNIILDLKTKLNAKRINLQVIGELNYIIRESITPALTLNEKNISINEVMKNYKKNTSLAGIQRQKTNISRQISSYSKVTNFKNSENTPSYISSKKFFKSPLSNKVVPEYQLAAMNSSTNMRSVTLKQNTTLNRGVTRSNTKVSEISRQSTQATTEIFCHYLVPIFQFKRRLQPGKYDFPFSFEFIHLHAPTTDFSQNNFKLKIKYTLIAEVEEDPDDDSFAEEDEMSQEEEGKQGREKKPNLKCLTNLEIFWDHKKHLDDTDLYSEKPVLSKWRFSIPRPLCCFIKHKLEAEISIPRSIFTADDLIPFTLKIHGAPNPNGIDLRIDLFEELSNNLIDYRDTSKTNLSISFKKEVVNGTIIITGDIDLGTRLGTHSLRSDDWNISHTLEFYIKTKGFLSKHEEKYTLPCLIIPQMYQRKEMKRLTNNFLSVTEPQNEERLTLVHSKFRLEDRYDIVRNQNFSNAIELHEEEE